MATVSTEHLGFIEWAAASLTHPHEVRCGDAFLVKQNAMGALLCVIDGLGHGDEAMAAAQEAVAHILEHIDDDPTEIVTRCHQALRTTRGAVLSLASIDATRNILRWVGVGNVEGILMRGAEQREWLPLRSGIVGCRMPRVQTTEFSVSAGEILLMFSDGVTSKFVHQLMIDESPVEMAERIMSNHVRGNDDAVALVARYHGGDKL